MAQVFSCEVCEISRNTFSSRTPPVAASVHILINLRNAEYDYFSQTFLYPEFYWSRLSLFLCFYSTLDIAFKDINRNPANIKDSGIFSKSQRLKAINCCCKSFRYSYTSGSFWKNEILSNMLKFSLRGTNIFI